MPPGALTCTQQCSSMSLPRKARTRRAIARARRNVNGRGVNAAATGRGQDREVPLRHTSRSIPLAAAAVTFAAASLSLIGGPPAPGVPALLGRMEVLTHWPMLGLAWAAAIGALAAWGARLCAGLHRLHADDGARVVLVGALVVPATVPGASVVGLLPALLLSASLAWSTRQGADRRVTLMIAAAMVGVLADPRVAPAGAVALLAAARHLLAALARVPANDNAPPPFAWRVAPAHLQGSCPQFISE